MSKENPFTHPSCQVNWNAFTTQVINFMPSEIINMIKLWWDNLQRSTPRGVNLNNLIQIKTSNHEDTYTNNNIKIAMTNARSIWNKYSIVYNELKQNDIDVGTITEIWLKDLDLNWYQSSDLNNEEYTFKPINRQEGKGGSLALVHKPNITCNRLVFSFQTQHSVKPQ